MTLSERGRMFASMEGFEWGERFCPGSAFQKMPTWNYRSSKLFHLRKNFHPTGKFKQCVHFLSDTERFVSVMCWKTCLGVRCVDVVIMNHSRKWEMNELSPWASLRPDSASTGWRVQKWLLPGPCGHWEFGPILASQLSATNLACSAWTGRRPADCSPPLSTGYQLELTSCHQPPATLSSSFFNSLAPEELVPAFCPNLTPFPRERSVCWLVYL